MLAIGLKEPEGCLFSVPVDTADIGTALETLRLHAGGSIPDQILIIQGDRVIEHYDSTAVADAQEDIRSC